MPDPITSFRASCAACGSDGAGLVCPGCGALAPVREVERLDKFALLGLPPAAELKKAELESAYLKLSRKLHPDRFRGNEQEAAARRLAAIVNDAYATLKDPVKRAKYLITLRGGDPAAQAPAAFLAEQMDYRERMAETDEAGLDELAATIEAARKASLEAVMAALAESSPEAGGHKVAAEEFVKLTYWDNLARQVRERQARAREN